MSPEEVGDLLRFCSSVDPWLKQTSPEEGAVMVAGWGLLLGEVPADAAARYARAHYQHGDARTLTPGDLLDAWTAERRRAHDQDDAQARAAEAVPIGDALAIAVGGAGEYLAAMQAAIARGENPHDVPRPAGVRVRTYSPEAEARERRCVYWEVCVCTHTECRAGWLDDDTVVVGANGRSYPAAARCVRCEEGLLMAQEKGLARKPRRTAGAR